MMLHAVTLPGYESRLPLGINDRDDAINLMSKKMIDAIRNYDQSKMDHSKTGPRRQWRCGRTATDELRKETKGQNPIRIGLGTGRTNDEGEETGLDATAPPEVTDLERIITPEKAVRARATERNGMTPSSRQREQR